MKTCTKCKTEKQFTEFSKNSRCKDGLQSSCKDCVREYQQANAEKLAEYWREYRKANPDKRAALAREYNKANAENIAAQKRGHYKENAETIAAQHREYRKANPEKFAAYSRNRRARVRGAEGKHTAADIKEIFSSQRGLCATCETKLFKSGKKKFHADHIIPLVKGGANDKYNMQCLCPTCNLRKNAMHPIDWAKENGRLL